MLQIVIVWKMLACRRRVCQRVFALERKKDTRRNSGLVWIYCASDELFSYSGVDAGLTPA